MGWRHICVVRDFCVGNHPVDARHDVELHVRNREPVGQGDTRGKIRGHVSQDRAVCVGHQPGRVAGDHVLIFGVLKTRPKLRQQDLLRVPLQPQPLDLRNEEPGLLFRVEGDHHIDRPFRGQSAIGGNRFPIDEASACQQPTRHPFRNQFPNERALHAGSSGRSLTATILRAGDGCVNVVKLRVFCRTD